MSFTKECEKKIISEYVELSNKAKHLYKSKKYEDALKLLEQCQKKLTEISSVNYKCECSYYMSLCYYKLYDAELSNKNFNITKCYLDCTDKSNFPYMKYYGRIYAHLILTLIALDQKENCANFISDTVINSLFYNFNLEQKVVIFHRLIKDLLYPIKNHKLLTNFLGDFISEQNNILFNGETTINSNLKSSLNKCLTHAKKTIFTKNNQYYYKYKYKININHPLLIFFDTNMSMFESCESNSFSLKMQLENFIKSNKLKISDDFKGMKTIDIIKEYKKRMENFDEIWKNISEIFCNIFKGHFATCSKKIKHSSSTDKLQSSTKKQNGEKTPTSCYNNNKCINIEPSSISPNINMKEKSNSKMNICEFGLCSNNISLKKAPQRKKSIQCESPTLKRGNNNSIKRNSNIIITNDFIKKCEKEENNKKKRQLFLENVNIKHTKYDYENNNYDKSRIKNINTNVEKNIYTRNYNPFLLGKIRNEYSKKEQLIRECDIINTRVNNYVKSFYSFSQKGNHKIIGSDIEDVNQDVIFFYNNYLLIKNLYFFGVCDGHGIQGHYISNYAKNIIPSYLNYIEIDNCISKKNKSIDSLLSSLYNKTENSSVKDIHIIKYFYDKFNLNILNINEFSIIKNNFNEISKNLKETFNQTDNDLLKSKTTFDTEKSGSTVCLLILYNKTLICANLGDSRAIICSCNNKKEWKSSQLTKDHKPIDQEEYTRIINSGGTVSKLINIDKDNEEVGPYRVWGKNQIKGPGLAMSRSLGDGMAKKLGVLGEPDIYEYVIGEEDKFVIVASDGVWEYLSNEDVMNIVKEVYLDSDDKAEEACELLVKNATDAWKRENSNTIDDISCVILFLNVK